LLNKITAGIVAISLGIGVAIAQTSTPLPSVQWGPGGLPSSIFSYGFNILAYGADPTGVRDSSPAFQKAVNIANGNPIVMPCGTFLLGSAVVSSVPIWLKGCGAGIGPGVVASTGVTRLIIQNDAQDGFDVTSNFGSQFEDFQMISAVPQTSGIGLNLVFTPGTGHAAMPRFKNLMLGSLGFTTQGINNPISITRPNWPVFDGIYCQGWGAKCISLVTTAAIEGSGGFIYNSNFFGDPINGWSQGPPIYSEVGYTDIHDNEILAGNISIQFAIKNNPAGFIKIHDNTIENSENHAIKINSQDGSAVSMVMIQNNEFSNVSFASNVTDVIGVQEYLVAGVGQQYVDNILIQGNIFRDLLPINTKYIWIQAGKNVNISNNIIAELGANNPFGIQVTGSTSNAGLVAPIVLSGNQITGTLEANRYALTAAAKSIVKDTTGMTTAGVLGITGVAEGSQIYATDADPASSPCTHVGAQTGAMATFQSGAWKCF
jgi:hypothetical protein